MFQAKASTYVPSLFCYLTTHTIADAPASLRQGYTWFISIIAGLVAFAIIGGYSTYRFMVRK
jgi:hypothetical protein